MIVCGCDVGSGSVKLVVMDWEKQEVLFSWVERIRRRPPQEVVNICFDRAAEAGYKNSDFAYIAATGEGDAVPQRSGYFFSMTCHARGARYFFPEAASVLDMGALHMRAMKLNRQGRVVAYKMTSQCASGTGQFLENICRYLGVMLEEIPDLSLQAREPKPPSTICAVLAETDVINLVSQGTPLPDIVRGIHDSIAQRAVKLLSTFRVESPLVLTGGLAVDKGLIHALEVRLNLENILLTVHAHPSAILAGAIGAALWGGWRCLQRRRGS
jgi:benzoyl-CoA reductase subunit D